MQRDLYAAALQLLQAGAIIDEVTAAPATYRIALGRDRVPIPGHVVQQLVAHRKIHAVCQVSGKRRFVLL
ncbi:MAG: hypothetical protein KGL42_10995 [Betaproteobacteria bacterium]|nr:hypothetical protein [Betaproteobacteria bacterium]